MSNIGKTIRDGYCNGFFGRDFDFYGSVIIAEGEEYIVIRKENGVVVFGNFQSYDWNRNEDVRKEQQFLTPMYIDYIRVQRWDGKYPTTMLGGNTSTLLNLNK